MSKWKEEWKKDDDQKLLLGELQYEIKLIHNNLNHLCKRVVELENKGKE